MSETTINRGQNDTKPQGSLYLVYVFSSYREDCHRLNGAISVAAFSWAQAESRARKILGKDFGYAHKPASGVSRLLTPEERDTLVADLRNGWYRGRTDAEATAWTEFLIEKLAKNARGI